MTTDESMWCFAPKAFGTSSRRHVVKTIVVLPIDVYLFVDVSVQARFSALAAAQYLDEAYFNCIHLSYL
ncbi:hypothetical protein FIBSPDRAFT_964509 [Athelia psychrophila]|uniref:Uncharacterized protein n=1 Tax=Athelia psychrophila TaxID=1759441 RepID=A0A165XQF9_9AGAM|nr:hypothetical protein FIBSPDRAFT_964509 [Fibularhizoctonia sp. CBS 109695]